MELIDREKLIRDLKTSAICHANNTHEETLLYRDRNIVREQPTVEAIPKADYEQLEQRLKSEYLRGLADGMEKGIEDTIPKDQYEARLKADMVAMLKELDLEIDEIHIPDFEPDYKDGCYFMRDTIKCLIADRLISDQLREFMEQKNGK